MRDLSKLPGAQSNNLVTEKEELLAAMLSFVKRIYGEADCKIPHVFKPMEEYRKIAGALREQGVALTKARKNLN